jgi:hypothetical protein
MLIGKLLVRGEHPGAIDLDLETAKRLFPVAWNHSRRERQVTRGRSRLRLTTLQPNVAVWINPNTVNPSIQLWYPNKAEWEIVANYEE